MKKSFGERLRNLRGGRTQSEMARILGVKQQTYQRYEAGVNEPDIETLHEIGVRFNATGDYLLGIGDAAGPIAADSPPAAATAAPDPPPPWLAIIASQQETIALLVRRLAPAAGPTRAPAPAGGQAATKIA